MENNNLSIKIIEGIPSVNQINVLLKLYTTIFTDAKPDFFKQRIQEKENVLSLIAYKDSLSVGFKIGYRYNETTFYSWVGGVLANYRKQGIAKELAEVQENWVKANQYTKIRTKSMNRFKPMLILNLKNGFDIKQVYTNTQNQTKIIFEKKLQP